MMNRKNLFWPLAAMSRFGEGWAMCHASLPFLKSDECEKVKGQLSYMKEERQQSRSRGFQV